MTRRLGALLLLGSVACASATRLTASPAEYSSYRTVVASETQEARLAAAYDYLRRYPTGAWRAEVARRFRAEEPRYFAQAYDDPLRLRAYLRALPAGPHHVQAARRLRELELAAEIAQRRAQTFEARAREITAELDAAALGRRTVVEEVSRFSRLLGGIRTWGSPTSELESELIHRWRIVPPVAHCAAGRCVKEVAIDFAVPESGALAARQALFDVILELARGGVARAVLQGPELWNRVAEAVTLRPVAAGEPLARLDAIVVALQVVENALEPVVPAARCAVGATSPEVLVRQCDGVRVTMIAAPASDEEDRLVVEPAAVTTTAP
jgi:hypothetical protein